MLLPKFANLLVALDLKGHDLPIEESNYISFSTPGVKKFQINHLCPIRWDILDPTLINCGSGKWRVLTSKYVERTITLGYSWLDRG